MASGSPPPASATFAKAAEPMNVSGLFFAPQSGSNNAIDFLSNPPFNGGGAYLNIGTNWSYSVGPIGTVKNIPNVYQSTVWLRNGDTFSSNPNDNYVRFTGKYTGIGLPNGGTAYDELQIFYHGNAGPGVDVSHYQGFSFYTRGTGNFSVCLISGSQSGSPPAPGPYIQLNFYQYLFNNYLTGSPQWRQVVVYFQDMTQTYGLATNLQQVLQNFYGLQFQQLGSPGPAVDENVWLDVDYIRFF